jgi:DNA segregation ATPase FtsK/SpoIIIE-like protein
MREIERDLERLRDISNFKGGDFGVSFIQRRLHLGYNRAYNVIQLAITENVVFAGSNAWSYEFNPDEMNAGFHD